MQIGMRTKRRGVKQRPMLKEHINSKDICGATKKVQVNPVHSNKNKLVRQIYMIVRQSKHCNYVTYVISFL